MARHIGPVCRLCRREGVKLFLKGTRCFGSKCGMEKRDCPPGVHNWRRGKLSEYGKRFREKQKLKRYYGVFEAQFRRYIEKAEQMPGNLGENLLMLLEGRLDNVLFRGGFALSRPAARQLATHGHVRVNGRKLDIASYNVQQGDVIQPCEDEASKKLVSNALQVYKAEVPSWLEKSAENLQLKMVSLPVRSEVKMDIQEQLIVEFYSR